MSGKSPDRVKVCIPVVGPGLDEALRQIRAAAPSADLLELRMDLIGNVNLTKLVQEIRSNPFRPRIVATHRKKEESGLQQGPDDQGNEEERIAALREAIRLGADYVDVELSTPAAFRDSLKELITEHQGRAQLIISWHNFRETPSEAVLENIWQSCREAEAKVIKMVTYANTMADNLRMLRLIPWSLEKGQEIVAFSMGELGKISRIMAPLLGAHFTFASLGQETATASGQLTAAEMFRIWKILGRSGPGDRHRIGKSLESRPGGIGEGGSSQ